MGFGVSNCWPGNWLLLIHRGSWWVEINILRSRTLPIMQLKKEPRKMRLRHIMRGLIDNSKSIRSMYGACPYIQLIFMLNVGRYTIDRSSILRGRKKNSPKLTWNLKIVIWKMIPFSIWSFSGSLYWFSREYPTKTHSIVEWSWKFSQCSCGICICLYVQRHHLKQVEQILASWHLHKVKAYVYNFLCLHRTEVDIQDIMLGFFLAISTNSLTRNNMNFGYVP